MNTPIPVSAYVILDGVMSLASQDDRLVVLVRVDQLSYFRLHEGAQTVTLHLSNGDTVTAHVEDKETFEAFTLDLITHYREPTQ